MERASIRTKGRFKGTDLQCGVLGGIANALLLAVGKGAQRVDGQPGKLRLVVAAAGVLLLVLRVPCGMQ